MYLLLELTVSHQVVRIEGVDRATEAAASLKQALTFCSRHEVGSGEEGGSDGKSGGTIAGEGNGSAAMWVAGGARGSADFEGGSADHGGSAAVSCATEVGFPCSGTICSHHDAPVAVQLGRGDRAGPVGPGPASVACRDPGRRCGIAAGPQRLAAFDLRDPWVRGSEGGASLALAAGVRASITASSI